MPTLKNLNCSIEFSNPDQTLREYGSFYGDGFVETFVAVPSDPKKFAVRLQSTTYIAEGLAMYVFIDGVYQCNRNRQALEDRVSKGKKPDRRSLVNFVVRQKEERQKDGEMVARSWNFEKLNIVSADEAPQKCLPNVTENIGCIEVLVLRCKGSRTSTPKDSMGFDGTYDKYNGSFSMDGKATEWGFDDRTWPQQIPRPNQRSWGPDRPASDYGAPSQPASVVERDHTGLRRSHSQHPAPSVITNSRLPAGSFRYGSGPLPETTEELFAHRTPSDITASDIVKPDFLKSIAKAAFREGQEAERRKTATQTPLQPPVDWPRGPGHLQQAPPFYGAKESMGPVAHGPPPSVWTAAPADAPHNNAWVPSPGIWPQGQSGLSGLGPPHVSDSSTFLSTYGTNTTANLAVAPMKPKSTKSQSGSRKSTSWPGDDEWVSVPPVSRSKNGSRSQKTHARETKSATPSKWDEDLIDISPDNSWGNAGEHGWASDSTITPPHGATGHSRKRKSRSSRTPARSAVPIDAAWGPTPNALPVDAAPAPSDVSTYASSAIATYSGREKKLYDELPPAPLSTNNLRHPNGRPISPPPPYGIAPAIFKLKVLHDVGSSGSRTASWESTKVDESPLAWNDSKNSAAAPKSHKSHSKHESPSVSQTAKEKKKNSNEISGWGNPDATPTMPGSWNQPSSSHESGWGNGVSGDSTDIQGDGLGVQVTADQKHATAPEGWGSHKESSHKQSQSDAPSATWGGDWGDGGQDGKAQDNEAGNSWTWGDDKKSSKGGDVGGWGDDKKSSKNQNVGSWGDDKKSSKSHHTYAWGASSEKQQSVHGSSWGKQDDSWAAGKTNSEEKKTTPGAWPEQDTWGDTNTKDISSKKSAGGGWASSQKDNKSDKGAFAWDQGAENKSKAGSAWGGGNAEATPAWGADAQDKNADSGLDTGNQESPAAWGNGDSNKNANVPSGWKTDKQDGKATWDTNNKDAKSATAWGPGTGNQDNTAAWDTGNKEAATGWDTANNGTTPAWNTDNKDAAAPAWDTDNKDATAPAWDTGNQDATPAWNTNNQNETPAPDAWNVQSAPSDKKSKASQPPSRKSRLHSYHRGTTRRHWVFPPPPPSTSQLLNPVFEDPAALDIVTNGLAPKSKRIWSLPSEPIPTIPSDKEDLAKKEGVEYAVRAGKGLKYTHAVNRPEYMDSLASPYAVFRFKYRTRDYLQNMFGKDVVPDEENEGRGIETASVVKQKLKGMSEQQMVEEILRLKGLDVNGGKKDGNQVDKGKQASASAGNGNGNWNGDGNGDAKEGVWAADLDMKDEVGTFVKDWVGEQQARSKHSSKKGSEKAASAGGGGCGGDAWGGDLKKGSKKDTEKAASAGADWGGGGAGGYDKAAEQKWTGDDEKNGSGGGGDVWGGGDDKGWSGGDAGGDWKGEGDAAGGGRTW